MSTEEQLTQQLTQLEGANTQLKQYLESPEHNAQMARVKAMSTELHSILQKLADEFGCTKQEMAKLIQRRLERREKEGRCDTK